MSVFSRRVRYVVVACAIVSSACTSSVETGPVESSAVAFDDLVISARASSNGVSALVDAHLEARSLARPVNLKSDDAIFVEDGTGRRELAPLEGGAALVFPSTAQRFDVVLVRGSSENRVPVELPSPFVLAAPAKASRTEGFTVTFEADARVPTTFLVGRAGASKLALTAKAGVGEITVNGADLAGKGPFKVEVRAQRVANGGSQVRTVEVEIVP